MRDPEVFAPARLSISHIAERCAGALLLTLSSPLIALCGLSISAISRRSPFVAHLRVGRHGSPLWVWKLRTMWELQPPRSTEQGWVERLIIEPSEGRKDPCDTRVTNKFARFCRRHSIDELPQFWHLMCGEMSMIGPRPLTRTELSKYYGSHAGEVLSVAPGITGLWQTQGRSRLDWSERVALDLQMVRTRSVTVYTSILFRTVAGLFSGHGAW